MSNENSNTTDFSASELETQEVAHTPEPCKCIEKTNAALQNLPDKQKCELDIMIFWDGTPSRAKLITVNAKGRAGISLGATYCPFCGVKYPSSGGAK